MVAGEWIHEVQSWLQAKFHERRRRRNIIAIHIPGGDKPVTEADCWWSLVGSEELHDFLIGISAPVEDVLAFCFEREWIRCLERDGDDGTRIQAYDIRDAVCVVVITPRWSPHGTVRRWLDWFKLAGHEISDDTLDRRIADGTYTAKQPRERGRLILDINKLPAEMQTDGFWNSATTPQK